MYSLFLRTQLRLDNKHHASAFVYMTLPISFLLQYDSAPD
jgi:hypothetical protein